jgi:hypothetical protein
MHSDMSLSASQLAFSSAGDKPLTSNEILARNCIYLILYLGLQGAPSPVASQPIDKEGVAAEADSQWFSPLPDQSPPQELALDKSDVISDERAQDSQTQSPSPISESNSNASTIPLSKSSNWSPEKDIDSYPAKCRPTCPKCNETFSTTTNRNRHLKYDCQQAQKPRFPCRNKGCKSHFSREAYRHKHERLRCKANR